MKLTKEALKRIIKEELEAVMDEVVRGNTTEEDEFEMSLVGSVLSGNTRKLEKEKKLLNNLAYYLGNPRGVSPQSARTEIGRIKSQLREPKAKGYDLDDPRIVADLVRLYDDISQNTLQYYRKHHDKFNDYASGEQIHKLAKKEFGEETEGVDSDGKGRSFTQKIGSFFRGKGFKEE